MIFGVNKQNNMKQSSMKQIYTIDSDTNKEVLNTKQQISEIEIKKQSVDNSTIADSRNNYKRTIFFR